MRPKARRLLYNLFPRSVHRSYADLCGYFWSPCDNCNEPFGGHEIPVPWAAKSGKVVCPMCTVQVGKYKAEVTS